MINGIGFCVIYRARVRPELESSYIAAWSRLNLRLREQHGAQGSRLHRGADGIFYADAQWESAQARAHAFSLPSLDPVASQQMAEAIIESLPEIVLDPILDHLLTPGEASMSASH